MNVSLSGIPLGEWRDLTDDELIDLFKLIERSSSEAKPKAKAKPKTTGIKRPVVAIEKAMRKRARHQAVSALPRRDERRKDVNVCRASAYSPTENDASVSGLYACFFFNWRAFCFSLTQRHQLIDVLLFTLLVSELVSGRPCAIRARSSNVFSSRCSRSVISFWVMRGVPYGCPQLADAFSLRQYATGG